MENNEVQVKAENPVMNMQDSITRLEQKLNYIAENMQNMQSISQSKEQCDLDNRLIIAYSQTYGLFADCFMQAGFGNESIPFALSYAYQKKLEKLFELQMKKAKKMYKLQVRRDKKLARSLSKKDQ